MWDFSVSYNGLAVAGLLVLISLFVQFIYIPNVKYKYRDYDSSVKESGVRSAKFIMDKKGYKVYYKKYNNYFQNHVDIKNDTIRLDNHAFIHSKIHDQVNASYIAYKYTLAKEGGLWFVSKKPLVNLIATILAFNLMWTLAFSAWILVGIFGSLLLLVEIIWISLNYKLDQRAVMLAWEQLRVTTDFKIQYLIQKNMKYKKIDSLKNALLVFSAPLFSGFKLLKDWGNDE